jgi:5-methylcytosine-specific restriction endonuclease McrA
MGLDEEKKLAHSKKMVGRSAWNKGDTGVKPWMNISGLNKGEPWNKGKRGVLKAWNKGIKNPSMTGEKNHNWKGGVTKINDKIRKSIEYKKWRTEVFKRDNYTCQLCLESKSVSGKLEADHIKPFAHYPELRLDVGNGRTLCKDCHKNTETYLHKSRWPVKKNA